MTDFRKSVDEILTASVDAFGEQVEWRPRAGGIFFVRGIFDNTYHALDPQTQQVVSVNVPVLGVNLNDLKFDPKQGDIIKIRGKDFTVTDKEEDGQGGARFFLHKESINERIKDTRVR